MSNKDLILRWKYNFSWYSYKLLSIEYPIISEVPKVLYWVLILYMLFTSELPNLPDIFIDTYADVTAILGHHPDVSMASNLLQGYLDHSKRFLKNWRIQINSKSGNISYRLCKKDYSPIKFNNDLDKRLNWQTHI